jgi:hypothetical protein
VLVDGGDQLLQAWGWLPVRGGHDRLGKRYDPNVSGVRAGERGDGGAQKLRVRAATARRIRPSDVFIRDVEAVCGTGTVVLK